MAQQPTRINKPPTQGEFVGKDRKLSKPAEAWFNALLSDSFTLRHISGMVPGNNGANSIDFTAGEAKSNDDSANIPIPAQVGNNASAAWARGPNAGKRATGAAAWGAGSWHWFVLGGKGFPRQSDARTADYVIDDNAGGSNIFATAAINQAGYTKACRVWSAPTAGAVWRAFVAHETSGGGIYTRWDVQSADFTDVNPGAAAVVNILKSIPAGIRVMADLNWQMIDSTPASSTLFLSTETDQTNTAPGGNDYDMTIQNAGATVPLSSFIVKRMRPDTVGQIRYRLSGSTADLTIKCRVIGYEDYRRS